MAADTIIRLIASTLAIVVIIFVIGVGYMLADPIYNNVIDESLLKSLGWGTPQDTVMLFMGLGLVGLLLVIIIWWIVARAKDDVRQEIARQRPPF